MNTLVDSRVLLVSGPSAVGKDTLLDELVAHGALRRETAITTRPPRPGEVDGIHYRFVTVAVFHQMVRDDSFLDWDYTLSNYYGINNTLLDSSAGPVGAIALARMALRLKRRSPCISTLFLKPGPEMDIVRQLQRRGVQDFELLARVGHALEELHHSPLFDDVVITQSGTSRLSECEKVLAARGFLREPYRTT